MGRPLPVLRANSGFVAVIALIARNESEMMVFRFLSGLGGSAPLAIGGGLLSDVWHPEQRGKAISIYSKWFLCTPPV